MGYTENEPALSGKYIDEVEPMNCYVCGKELREGASFCHNCGANLANAPVSEENAQPEVTFEEVVTPEVEEVPVEEGTCEAEPEAAPVEENPAAPEQKSPYEYDPLPQSEQEKPPAQKRRAFWLPENRSLWKMILFGILTFGIYDLAVLSRIPEETNMVINGRDGNRTQQFWWMIILGSVTLGIYPLVWMHGLCNRIGEELNRRCLGLRNFGASDFWIWCVLGTVIGGSVASILSLVVGAVAVAVVMDIAVIVGIEIGLCVLAMVGPCVFLHRLCKAVNVMNKDYNLNG